LLTSSLRVRGQDPRDRDVTGRLREHANEALSSVADSVRDATQHVPTTAGRIEIHPPTKPNSALTLRKPSPYLRRVQKGTFSTLEESETAWLWGPKLAGSFVAFWGRKLLRFVLAIQGLGAFALITLGVIFAKFGVARRVILPLVFHQAYRAGLRLLPMVLFFAAALGLVVIGQTVSLLTRVGVKDVLGTVMVVVIVRELGPLLTALLVMARTGTAHVIELGTARALGEVEALEVLGIDPIHYLVVPRVIGMALGIFALTVYLILGALVGGYGWAFLQDVPLRPGEYFSQLAGALSGLDFVILAFKSGLFGSVIALITCYQGLARPLHLEEVSGATIRAVAQAVIACVLVDAFFLLIYLLV
jgi:phospholipid/cholesterol/gamma-HCH transport system permease protein